MNDFNITLTITDVICCKNCKDSNQVTTAVTSSSQTIELKNNFILNVVRVTSTYFTVLIQNGIETIIRNVFISSPLQLCLPCKCCSHMLTISGIINPT
ncbi:MAG: hypothetical protein PHP54_01675 [Clostridia bacterium]|nr:hypothetical protein [Clostridia bacterium]